MRWIETALRNPYTRQRPLCIYGPPCSGKTLLCRFLIGYFQPYNHLWTRNTASIYNYDLQSCPVLCFIETDERPDLSQFDGMTYDVRRKFSLTPVTGIPNRTQWIIESHQQIADCELLPMERHNTVVKYTLHEAHKMGIDYRRRDIVLTSELLQKVIKS